MKSTTTVNPLVPGFWAAVDTWQSDDGSWAWSYVLRREGFDKPVHTFEAQDSMRKADETAAFETAAEQARQVAEGLAR